MRALLSASAGRTGRTRDGARRSPHRASSWRAQLKRPVQVVLSQASSQNQDRVAPGALARMTALPGAGGITAAWSMRVATADGLGAALARLDGEACAEKLGANRARRIGPALFDPECEDRSGAAPTCPSPPATCADRRSASSPSSPKASSTSWRMRPGWSRWPSGCRCSAATAGSRAACRARRGSRNGTEAGAEARWGSPAAPPSDRTSAWSQRASIGADQRVKVHRLVAAVDCGRVVNSGLVAQQIEAGLIWALAQATVPVARMGRRNAARTADRRHRPAAPWRHARKSSSNHPEQRRARRSQRARHDRRSRRRSPTPSMPAPASGCARCRSILWQRHEPPADHPAIPSRRSACC